MPLAPVAKANSHQDDHLQVLGLQPARSGSLCMAERPCSELFSSPKCAWKTGRADDWSDSIDEKCRHLLETSRVQSECQISQGPAAQGVSKAKLTEGLVGFRAQRLF